MFERVLAQQNIGVLAPNPNITTFGQILSVVLKNAFVVAGILCLILLIFGGFTVIVSAGDTKKSQQGKDAVTGAVAGLALVIGSFWIAQALGVITGLDILNPSF